MNKEIKNEINEEAAKELEDILDDSLKLFTEFKKLKNLTDKYNTDNTRALGYHGRELFELIQNVDDAYTKYKLENNVTESKNVEAFIEYTGDKLFISNKGTVFDDDSILRLCQGGVSNKHKENYIGNKGIGFRSVLNWSSDIRIYSDKYSVRFSKEFADEQMKILHKRDINGIVKEQLDENPNITFPLFYAPEPIAPINLNGFDTVIELIISPETQNDEWNIENQIKSFKEEILLFLPNIKKITFKLNNDTFSYEKRNGIEKKQFIISRSPQIGKEKSFYLFSNIEDEKLEKYKIIEDKEEKTVKLAFAIPCDFNANNYPFYTFFPIRQTNCPFNALMHASFSLSENRDAIISNVVNIQVFKLLLEFYVDEVTNYFSNSKYGKELLKLLTPKNFQNNYSFGHPFENENNNPIINYYLDLCRKHKIFFTCSKQFISVSDNPKIISNSLAGGQYPECFNNSNFYSLIPTIENNEIEFVKSLMDNRNIEYTAYELLENIEKSRDNWENDSHSNSYWNVYSFCWWVISFQSMEKCPETLKDDKGNFIKNSETCFFSGAIKDVPNWAKYCLVSSEYENEMISLCSKKYKTQLETVRTESSDKNKRLTIRYFAKNSTINFREYDVVSLISPVNTSIKGDYSRAIEFVKWLWKNSSIIQKAKRSNNDNIEKNLHIIDNANFPDIKGDVKTADNLFFGNEYSNPSGEYYFIDPSYSKFALPNNLEFDKENKKDICDFFEQYFGVLTTPKIINIPFDKLSKQEKVKYQTFIIKEIKKQNHNHVQIDLSKITIPYIPNLQRLLTSLSTEKIIEMILSNNEIKSMIKNPLIYDTNLQTMIDDQRTFHSDYRKFTNFISYMFSTIPWIDIGAKKQLTCECILSDNEILSKYITCISKKYINKIKKNHTQDEIKEIFLLCGVKNKEYELSTKLFYNLLLQLQEDNNTKEISKRIYRESVKALGLGVDENDPDRLNFIKTGKVLSKTTKEYEYINDVYFSSSVVLNLMHKKLLDMPLKNGDKQIVQRLFGVQPYTEEYSINKSQNALKFSILNKKFIEDLNEYKPYAYSLRKEELEINSEKDVSDEELKKIQNLEVFLVSKISLIIKGKEEVQQVTELYSLIKTRSDSSWYIYVGDLNSFDKLDKRRIASLLVQIFEIILNSQKEEKLERYAEFYRSSKEDRDYLIEEYFGTLNVIRESKNILKGQRTEKEELRKYLKDKKLYSQEIENLLTEIDLIKSNDFENQKRLYNLLKKINIEPKDLAKVLGYEDISIRLVNIEAYTLEKNKIIDYVRNDIFESLSINKLFLTKNIYSEEECFKNYLIENEPDDSTLNSLDFNPVPLLNENRNAWLKNHNFTESSKIIDLPTIYSKNLTDFLAKINKSVEEIHEFLNQNKIHNYLYFDINIVKEEYDKWQSNLGVKTGKSGTPKTKSTFVDNSEISDELIGSNIDSNNNGRGNNGENGGGGGTAGSGKSDDQDKQDQGDAAEEFVITHLKNKDFNEINNYFGLEKDSKDIYKIDWVSGAAERKAHKDGNDKLGYDIVLSYNGKKLYIEVKSSTKKACIFDISGNELTFAKAHTDNYLLIFVGNMKGKQNITVLPKDFIYRQDFIFISEKMKVIYTKKNESSNTN